MYLQDCHTFAPLRTQILQYGRKLRKTSAIAPDFVKFCVEQVKPHVFRRKNRGISPELQEFVQKQSTILKLYTFLKFVRCKGQAGSKMKMTPPLRISRKYFENIVLLESILKENMVLLYALPFCVRRKVVLYIQVCFLFVTDWLRLKISMHKASRKVTRNAKIRLDDQFHFRRVIDWDIEQKWSSHKTKALSFRISVHGVQNAKKLQEAQCTRYSSQSINVIRFLSKDKRTIKSCRRLLMLP